MVCGQGRIEAYSALGHKEIPAIVVEITKEERLLRSLVENMARRLPGHLALMNEIERLKDLGYNNCEIGKKLDIADSTVGGYLALKNAGEERILDAAIQGRIPFWVAMDIAKADSVELQRGLLKVIESKQLSGMSVRTVKRLMDQRRFSGKKREATPHERAHRTSAESLMNAYRRESQRQKALIRKARLCEAKLIFIVTAFKKLLSDENFITLLRAEALSEMPKYVYQKITIKQREAA